MPNKFGYQSAFSQIRYAQCWEDAEVLLAALDVQPERTYLSIASGGDNTLSLLSRRPRRVIAVDVNPAQIACLALRVAAYRQLSHSELLILLGSRHHLPDMRLTRLQVRQLRSHLYQRCRPALTLTVREFWDRRSSLIQQGIGAVGKFERYIALFRRYILPLIHSQSKIDQFLQIPTVEGRQQFYNRHWNNWRWQLLFRLFFSRLLMAGLGRDRHAFRYVQDSLVESLLPQLESVLITLEPAQNPYLHWLVYGYHPTVLPYSLRPENFETIRTHLDRLEWHCTNLENFLEQAEPALIDGYNLSDVFEWMSPQQYHYVLKQLVRVGRTGGCLVYWNLLVERHRPAGFAHQLRSLTDLARALHQQDRVFFYKTLVIEKLIA